MRDALFGKCGELGFGQQLDDRFQRAPRRLAVLPEPEMPVGKTVQRGGDVARHVPRLMAQPKNGGLRTREIVTTSGFFAILVAVLASVAFTVGDGKRSVAPGVVWISVSFASVLALGRTWHREREESALMGLLVSPLGRSAIFAGKMMGVLAFLAAVELLVIPAAALLFSLDLIALAPGFLLIAAFATPGIAASGTLFGAMTVRTRARFTP